MSPPPKEKIAVAAGLAVAGAVFVLWPLLSYTTVKNCEQPDYETLLVLGKKKRSWLDRTPAVTIRKYKPYLVAEVEVSADAGMKDATSKGFRQIANFIFGNNVGAGASEEEIVPDDVDFESMKGGDGEKVAMTTPVVTEIKGTNKATVSFIMPSKYTKDTLPKPRNSKIKIKEVPGHFLAALSWRGGNYPSQEAVEAKVQELRATLSEHNIEAASGDSKLYGYYPPFAFPALKLYDVLLEVKYEEGGLAETLPVVDASKAPGSKTFAEMAKESS